MKDINYDIPLLTQNIQDCVQSSAAQLLSYYGIGKSIEDIKKEVPIFISDEGKPLGSALGHIATYFIHLGFHVTLHSADIEIFDRSWQHLDNETLITNLQERRKYLKHPRYENEALDLVVNGYTEYLKKEGTIVFPVVDTQYIYNLLQNGPIYAVLNYNLLNNVSKYRFIANGKPVKDSIKGAPSTHAVIISGFRDGKFEITDPDYEFGGIKLISSGLLIGAFYLAETDFDPLLITLSK